MVFLEGGTAGPHSKALNAECREGFRKLLEKAGFSGRLPRLIPCGSRGDAYREFRARLRNSATKEFVALWVDSEDPVADVEKPWTHLEGRSGDEWVRPKGAEDEQIFLMTTCMETLYLADRKALLDHFGTKLRESAMLPSNGLENRNRHEVQKCLETATRDCPNTYAKGKRSYLVLQKLSPATLSEHLPSFRRTVRILEERL